MRARTDAYRGSGNEICRRALLAFRRCAGAGIFRPPGTDCCTVRARKISRTRTPSCPVIARGRSCQGMTTPDTPTSPRAPAAPPPPQPAKFISLRIDAEVGEALEAIAATYAERGVRVTRSALIRRAAHFGIPFIAREAQWQWGAGAVRE